LNVTVVTIPGPFETYDLTF